MAQLKQFILLQGFTAQTKISWLTNWTVQKILQLVCIGGKQSHTSGLAMADPAFKTNEHPVHSECLTATGVWLSGVSISKYSRKIIPWLNRCDTYRPCLHMSGY